MLGDAKLESLVNVDSCSPGVYDADGVGRPGIQGLWHVLAEEKRRRAEDHEPAQESAAEGTDLENSRQHVAREQIAGGAGAAVLLGVSGALVRVDLVVRRGEIELGPSPECVAGEKEASAGIAFVPTARGIIRLRAGQR